MIGIDINVIRTETTVCKVKCNYTITAIRWSMEHLILCNFDNSRWPWSILHFYNDSSYNLYFTKALHTWKASFPFEALKIISETANPNVFLLNIKVVCEVLY